MLGLNRLGRKPDYHGNSEIDASGLIRLGIVEILSRPDLDPYDYPWRKLSHMTLRYLAAEAGRSELINVVAYFACRLSFYEEFKQGDRRDIPFALHRLPGFAYSVNVGRADRTLGVETVLLSNEQTAEVNRLMTFFAPVPPVS